jgi:CO/xanthine dehydrogenase Mo-binding subunit
MDDLAGRLGLDPMEIRLRNAIETGKKMATGVTTLDAAGMRNSLHEVAEMSGWRKRHRIERRPAPHLRRGWGLACMMQGYLLGPKVADNAFASLEMNEDGSVMLRTGVVDYGQGSHTVLAQITAEALGVELAAVRVIGPDTDKTLESGSACASRVTFICGHAVLRAAKPIYEQLLQTAAEISSLPRSVLSIRLGIVHSGSTPLKLTVRQLAAAARAKSRPLSSTGYYSAEYPPKIFDERVFDNPCAYYTFGAKVAQVLVDTETGQVTVEKLFMAQDAGRILNPDGAMGQAEGGISMGFGYSVMEELIIEKGRTRNNSLESYLIPTVQDVPEIHVKYCESVDRYGPYGSRALSEGSVVPTAAAVANAIRDAVGVSMVRIPLTAERVLAAMHEGSKA